MLEFRHDERLITISKGVSPIRQEATTSDIIPLRIENGWVSLEQRLLPEIWLDEPIEAVRKSYGILIKPKSLSQKMRGVVQRRLTYEELDELYGQR